MASQTSCVKAPHWTSCSDCVRAPSRGFKPTAGQGPARSPVAQTFASSRASWPTDVRHRRQAGTCRALRIENRELLVGDVVGLVSFSIYKQIAGIVLSPGFPGWLAPLAFNPIRFAEFFSFCLTLCGSWVAACALVGGYEARATSDVPIALQTTSRAWLASMPVAAAQLVLVTALESGSLVGEPGFASALPLAASGPGEPFPTAAGVLGLMAGWRAFYTVYLDTWASSRSAEDQYRFKDATSTVLLLAAGFLAILQVLRLTPVSS